MKVAHLVPAAFGEGGVYGGAERYALELAKHMAPRVDTTLVTFGTADEVTMDGALRTIVIGAPHFVRGQRANPVSLRLLTRLRGVDVIHCHQRRVVASTLAALFARLSGKRVFVSDLGGGGWDLSAYVSTDRWYHGHLHISEYARRVAGHEHRPNARVILGGVDTERFRPPAEPSRGGPALFVGRLLPHKGVDVLVAGVDPDVPLEIIGRPYDRAYADHLRLLAEGKRVTFRFDVTDAELIEAYQRANCIVLPSVYRTMYGSETLVPELLGQTLLEGMACAAPGLATDVASLPEVVDDGVTGWIVPPNDPAALGAKLRWFRDDPAAARAMGSAGRARVLERFQWSTVVDRCLDAYANA